MFKFFFSMLVFTSILHILLQSSLLTLTLPNYNSTLASDCNSSNGKGDHQYGANPMSFFQLALAFAAPMAIMIFSIHLRLNMASTIFITVIRTIVQLLLLACVTLSLIFSIQSPVLVVAYLLFISLIAAYEVMNRQTRTYIGHYIDSLCAVLMGGGLVGCYGTIVVYNPIPWWNPRIMIPTTGMVIGSAVAGPSLAVERLLAEVSEKQHEPEIRLAFGANKIEAVLPIMRASIKAAITSNLNTMSVVGIVAIPGMMTGQLLGGSDPLTAAEYQMSILWLIFTSTFLSAYTAVHLAVKNAVFDNGHRFTCNKILKSSELKSKWTYASFLSNIKMPRFISNLASQVTNTSLLSPDSSSPRTIKNNNNSKHSKEPHGQYELVATHSNQSPIMRTKTDEVVSGRVGFHTESSIATDSIEMVDNTNIEDNNINCKANFVILENVPTFTSFTSFSSSSGVLSGSSGIVRSNHVSGVISQGGSSSSAYYQVPPVQHKPIFFSVKNLNVLSGELTLFDDEGINFDLRPGEILSIEGSSGIGKTRLLRALCQLDAPLSGEFNFIQDEGETSKSNPRWRRRCIYVPQALPSLIGTPKEFILQACAYKCRSKSVGSRQLIQHIDLACNNIEILLGLSEDKLSQKWSELSGGQRQRAIIACGLLLAATFHETKYKKYFTEVYNNNNSSCSSESPRIENNTNHSINKITTSADYTTTTITNNNNINNNINSKDIENANLTSYDIDDIDNYIDSYSDNDPPPKPSTSIINPIHMLASSSSNQTEQNNNKHSIHDPVEYKVGEQVLYTHPLSEVSDEVATVMAVHHDDFPNTYYTIQIRKIHSSGNNNNNNNNSNSNSSSSSHSMYIEKQTTGSRLKPINMSDIEESLKYSCVILFDEPTAACDMETTLIVERALIQSECAIIMITHDDRQALRMAHKRLILTTKA